MSAAQLNAISALLGSFFNLLAFGVGALVFYLAARQRKSLSDKIGYVALAGLIGGVLGAKLTEVALIHFSAFKAQPSLILDPSAGGRTIIGGLIGGWLAVEIAKRRLGIFSSTGDLFALALPAGETLGRIGCFFNGCCYGIPSRVPWAIYQHGQWRHPTQLYSSMFALAIFAALLEARKKLTHEGDLFRLYLVLFGLGRFLLEFLRSRTIVFGGLSLAQWACLELALTGALMLYWTGKRTRRDQNHKEPLGASSTS